MDYMYGQLYKQIKEIEYKGRNSETTVVTVDQKTRTIRVDVKMLSPEQLPKDEGNYVLLVEVDENGKHTLKWVSTQSTLDRIKELEDKTYKLTYDKDIDTSTFDSNVTINKDLNVEGNTVFNNKVTILGKYNEDIDEPLLSVGSESSDTSLKKAFEVLKDGRAKVQAAPKDNDDVVRFEEIDNVYVRRYKAATINERRAYIVKPDGYDYTLPIHVSALGDDLPIRTSTGQLKANDGIEDSDLTTIRQLNKGLAGQGLNTLTDVNLTFSNTTVQYDTTNGIQINSTARFVDGIGNHDATMDLSIPIVGKDTIIIDKAADGDKIEISGGGLATIKAGEGEFSEVFNYSSDRPGKAIGNRSHAEGIATRARSTCSHAEGGFSEAIGEYSHAEGYGAVARGARSHAEGESTEANGRLSHAEGFNTTAGDFADHAEGCETHATGDSSHAEGRETFATNYASHAEGEGTYATNRSSHAEGIYNINPMPTDLIHATGIGLNFRTRRDGFEVYKTGEVWCKGPLYVGGVDDAGADIYQLDRTKAKVVATAEDVTSQLNEALKTKVTRVPSGSDSTLYGEDPDGSIMVPFLKTATADTIPQRTATGQLKAADGVENNDLVTVKQLTNTNKTLQDNIDKKIDLVESDTTIALKNNSTISYTSSATASTIMQRDSNGRVEVEDGINNKDAVNKDQLDTKLDLTGGTLTGDLTIQDANVEITKTTEGKGNLTVGGNLRVNGTTTTVDAETLAVKDNLIVTNSGNTELVNLSGLAIKTGNKDADENAIAYGILYDPATSADSVKLGLGSINKTTNEFTFKTATDANPVATRDDSTKLTDNHLLVWNNAKHTLIDANNLADPITPASLGLTNFVLDGGEIA